MKKRVISFVLVLILAISLLGTSAFAAGFSSPFSGPYIIRNDKVVSMTNIKGFSGKTVVYPTALETTDAKYPVIVWANGTGCVTPLYSQLLALFANAGYIVVADSNVMPGDGQSIINSINYIITENNNSKSVFYGKVDVNNIGATGHSQGGKGVVCAAAKDSRIKCILSIAGASTAAEAKGVKCPAFYMTGSADFIVFSPMWVKPSYKASSGPAVYACLKFAPHTTCMLDPGEIYEYGVQWFNAYLRLGGDSAAVKQVITNIDADDFWKDVASRNF